MRQALIDFCAAGEALLRKRFEQAKAEGDLQDTAQPDALAAFVIATITILWQSTCLAYKDTFQNGASKFQ